jgi:hypothetical protein
MNPTFLQVLADTSIVAVQSIEKKRTSEQLSVATMVKGGFTWGWHKKPEIPGILHETPGPCGIR